MYGRRCNERSGTRRRCGHGLACAGAVTETSDRVARSCLRVVDASASAIYLMSKFLAIVPAYNEAGAIAGTVTEIRRHAPDFDVVVVDDGSTDDTSRLAGGGGRTGHQPSLQPRDRRRRAVRLPIRARTRLRRRRAGRRRRPARSAPHPGAALAPAREPRHQHGHGLALPVAHGRRLPLVGLAPARDPHLRTRPVAGHPPPGHRSDLRLPDDRSPRHRAVRPRLPARLSRGRGCADGPRPPARELRAAREHARAPAPAAPRSARRSRRTT